MDLDVTLIFQLTLFVALLVLLNGILFKPFLKVIEDRHNKIHGAKEEADRLARLAGLDRETYEARLRDAKRQAQGEREALRQSGREEERRLLAEVRAEIARGLNETREQVSAAERAAKQSLATQTDALARQLVEKVLGHGVSP